MAIQVRVRLDEDFCREVAEVYEHAPLFAPDPELAVGYEAFQQESRRQFESVVDSGIRVVPWRGAGQPYRDSADLRAQVRETGVLKLFLTSSGHGPGPSTAPHPLRRLSGVVADGVELTHNDVFRVVHDIHGHVLGGHGFGPRGEFLATRGHMSTFPEPAHTVLFTEQIGQICWFFYGPYGHLPAPRRPYAEQKVFAYERRFLDHFHSLFDHGEP
ncbi:crotonobetainyl-CoA--carnitine CoA-transferase [Lentzea sp. BCCO 10_0856]|uniref:Crotonobetainyl-CoA--carnitine CoA-transferase n=1 Tax=Lentzea miocenica TaxID=3095431 RepID=A0ABU4T7V2_9PSEU|nr:crotonobetainyl-CoA--carnitine CoA-transferase [Lentzea sp. BCCO 10_0856]MDX8034149.1 crotonobetainyl-CoA--carnitine CoA-transferase [Lentzea sp. BCCO 10_0856]